MEEHDYRHAGEARESRRDAQTLVQMNAPKPSANTLVNETTPINVTPAEGSLLNPLKAPVTPAEGSEDTERAFDSELEVIAFLLALRWPVWSDV